MWVGRGKSPRWGTWGAQGPRGIWGMPQNPRAEQSKVLRREAAPCRLSGETQSGDV